MELAKFNFLNLFAMHNARIIFWEYFNYTLIFGKPTKLDKCQNYEL